MFRIGSPEVSQNQVALSCLVSLEQLDMELVNLWRSEKVQQIAIGPGPKCLENGKL